MKKLAHIPKSGFYPKGFLAGAIHAGVKKKGGQLDLAGILSTKTCSAAGVFTSNIFKAAPVQVDQQLLETSRGDGFRSIVVNSGNANAVTGKQGIADAKAMIAASQAAIGEESLNFCMSTGVIGQRLPIRKITENIPELFANMKSDHDSWMTLAKGMMTTDTYPKLTSRTFQVGGNNYRLAGVAKGGGMISPNMATLLGVLATDAPVSARALQKVLSSSVATSFNAISVDGDMSTNDTILALANGASGGAEIDIDGPGYAELMDAVTDVSGQLARLVVRDGEGATKFVQIDVCGASSDASAKTIARSVASSSLVKTALYGKDANWGRILCAIGYSGEAVNPNQTSVSFIPTDGSTVLPLCLNGEPEYVDEKRALEILNLHDLHISIDVGVGKGSFRFWTTDLTHEYVTINGDYRS